MKAITAAMPLPVPRDAVLFDKIREPQLEF